jgi:hypothetical protein
MKIGNFIVDFLREFETIFKKALTRVSGALGELIYEEKKNIGRQSRVRIPLTSLHPLPG